MEKYNRKYWIFKKNCHQVDEGRRFPLTIYRHKTHHDRPGYSGMVQKAHRTIRKLNKLKTPPSVFLCPQLVYLCHQVSNAFFLKIP